MSKINLSYNKKEYSLEYSRESVKTMERGGFVLSEIDRQPATMIPMLFQGAFIKNHRGIKRNIMDEIYDEIGDKTGLMQALIEMYADTLGSLMDDKEAEGNVSWELVK